MRTAECVREVEGERGRAQVRSDRQSMRYRNRSQKDNFTHLAVTVNTEGASRNQGVGCTKWVFWRVRLTVSNAAHTMLGLHSWSFTS